MEQQTTTRLRAALRDHGVSVRGVARKAGCARSTASDCLHGSSQAPDVRLRLVVASRALGVPVPGDPWELVPDSSPGRAPRPSTTTPTTTDTELIPTKHPLDFDTLQYWKVPGLRDPFDELQADRLWRPPRLRWVQDQLVRAIRQRTMAAIVGDVGRGKSTLLRALHYECEKKYGDRVIWLTPGNLHRGTITEGGLAAAMLRDLGGDERHATLPSEVRGDRLRATLQQRCDAGQFPVLAIDEAHDLSEAGLIAIKRIWDSFTFNRALAVILCGQRPLRRTLETNHNVREVAGRTQLLDLPDLGADEATEYLGYRLGLVDLSLEDLFEDGAVEVLVNRGGRSPLWLDALASRALTHAAHRGAKQITRAIAARC
jgi:type II secretory pathway predicted ATPase ExeA/lambda repressor-like predicted transcriptional regulator